MSAEHKAHDKDVRATNASATLQAMRVEPYVDIHVAAAFLGVPVSWLYTQSKKGEVPVRRFGKYLRFRLSELQGGQGSNGNGDPQV